MILNAIEIRQFWFGSAVDDVIVADECSDLWWSKSSAVDAQMRIRFQAVVDAARRDEYQAAATTALGRLTLILLTDQFPRNIYRDTPFAFAADPLALNYARAGIACGADRELRLIERVFFYLPFEHSERLPDQQQAVALFTALADEAPASSKTLFGGYLDFAQRHCAVVQRFGRFPHRNAILNRPSTAEELQFLAEPNSSF